MRDAALPSLAVGFFDGVHLGHRAILSRADAALTFRNHPLSVLAPEKAPRLIMTPEDRVAAIKACGVKDVTVLDFTRDLAEMSAEDFVNSFLKRSGDRLPALRCGANWRFGKGGAGTAEWLRARGFEVTVVPYAEYQGEPVSSSRIRRCLENGEIEDANAMLGRRYQVRGTREEGKGLGRQIGYPTVNLRLSASADFIRLPLGVYEVEVEGIRGIANYGLAPTMGERSWRQPTLEVHFQISDPSSPIPDPSSPVSFLRFIRSEKKFASLADLKAQIAADCAKIGA